jgi:hypothetical protein
MFCGDDKSRGQMSMEHFVPQGLWDGPLPRFMKTCPAHRACNQAYSQDNEYFRDVLVSEEGAKQHPEVQKLYSGKIKRKLLKQPGSLRRIFQDIGMRPVFTIGNVYIGHHPAFQVDWDRMKRVIKNVMRGIHYTTQQRPLPLTWKLGVLREEEIDHEGLQGLFGKMVPNWENFGDDVFGCRYFFADTSMAALMQFYRRRTFFGWAWSPELYDSLRESFANDLLVNPCWGI